MRLAGVLLLILFAAVSGAKQPGKKEPASTFLLYSWRVEGGHEWMFTMRSGARSRPDTADEVFEPSRALSGVQALERKLEELPGPAEVVWIAKVAKYSYDPPEEGFERLEVPPPAVVDRVRGLIRKRGFVWGGFHGK